MSLTSVLLPDAATPVTTVITPSGKCAVHVLQVVFARASQSSATCPSTAAAPARCTIARLPRQILPRQRLGVRHDLLPACLRPSHRRQPPGARPQIEHVIRLRESCLHRAPPPAPCCPDRAAAQRLDQPLIVPLVQPDRRLIQHIQHPAQPRTNLRRQPDPLPLAARQRRRLPVQRKILQPHRVQKLQPLDNLLRS